MRASRLATGERFPGIVGRTIVDNDEFKIVVNLIKNALNSFCQIGLAVVDRHHNTYFRISHISSNKR